MRDILARQTMSPVRFHETLSNMIGQGIDTFVEVGVGATLEGFVKSDLEGGSGHACRQYGNPGGSPGRAGVKKPEETLRKRRSIP